MNPLFNSRHVNEIVKVKNRTRFVTLLRAMAVRTGQMLNYDNVADEVGVSSPTVKEWVSVLEASGIVLILQPFYSSTLNRAIKTPRVYFCEIKETPIWEPLVSLWWSGGDLNSRACGASGALSRYRSPAASVAVKRATGTFSRSPDLPGSASPQFLF